jgi:hypothetical protein
MLNFIQNQTNWYKEKEKALEKVRVEMLKQTPNGRYKLALRQQQALDKFNSIFKIATIIGDFFSPGYSKSKEMILAEQTMESMNKLIQLDLDFKRKQVYPSGGYQPNQSPFINNNEFIINPKQTKKQ